MLPIVTRCLHILCQSCTYKAFFLDATHAGWHHTLWHCQSSHGNIFSTDNPCTKSEAPVYVSRRLCKYWYINIFGNIDFVWCQFRQPLCLKLCLYLLTTGATLFWLTVCSVVYWFSWTMWHACCIRHNSDLNWESCGVHEMFCNFVHSNSLKRNSQVQLSLSQ